MTEQTKQDHVIRFIVTHIDEDGVRTMCGPSQGRHTHETALGAQQHLEAMMSNNRIEPNGRLAGVYGLPLEVRPVECYPGHFDPMGRVYFDTDDYAERVLASPRPIDELIAKQESLSEGSPNLPRPRG